MALRKKQENTSAALRAARRRLTASVLTTLLSLALVSAAVFEGVSFGWLALPTREVNSGGEAMTSQGVGTENGHDVFMYSEAEKAGVCIMGQTVTMNTYDKVFPLRNGKTPIILRAVLSPANAENAAAGLKLNLTCASKSYARETVDGETIDWLSNVANVRAAYIPGLESRAVEGKWTPYGQDASTAPYPYKDADDYIYSYALDFFEATKKTDENPNGVDAVTFVTQKEISEEDKYTEWSACEWKTVTSATEIGKATDTENMGTDANGITTVKEYEVMGYRIWNDDVKKYVYINSAGKLDFTDDEADASWMLESSGSGYKMRCGSYYLARNAEGYSAETTTDKNAAPDWEFIDSNQKIKIACKVNGEYRHLQIDNAGGGYIWELYNGIWDQYYLFTVSKQERSREHRTRPAMSSLEKVISIDVDLNAAKEENNGYYYVYLMIDYDRPLIDKYLTDNKLTWTIGSKGDITFKDEFKIEVVKK